MHNSNPEYPVQLFTHIGNEYLTTDFLKRVEEFKEETIKFNALRGFKVEMKALDHLNLLDLLSYSEENFNSSPVPFPVWSSLNGRNHYLDELMSEPLIRSELELLKQSDDPVIKDKLSIYRNSDTIDNILVKSNLSGMRIRHKNEFISTCLNCFINDDFNKLQHALEATSELTDQIRFEVSSPFTEAGFDLIISSLFRQARRLLKKNDVELEVYQSPLWKFGLDKVVSFDFTQNSVEDFKRLFSEKMNRFKCAEDNYQLADLLLSKWLIQQCSLYFYYHKDIDYLDELSTAISNVVADVCNIGDLAATVIKDIVFKQVLVLDPRQYREVGFGLEEFKDPMGKEFRASFGLKFQDSRSLYTYCEDKRQYWLASSLINQFLRSSKIDINSQDVIDTFSSHHFKHHMLCLLQPRDLTEYFLSCTNTRDEYLFMMAQHLTESCKNTNELIDIQKTYALKLVESNADKSILSSRLGIRWVNKKAVMLALKEHDLLGKYSAITLLGLTMDDFKSYPEVLSTTAKRMLLSQDLEL
jgi:hypothetical protein